MFCKKGVLKNFVKFTGKHLCQSFFLNKVAGLRPEVHPPDIPDSSRDTSVERSSQEIPSVRQEESNMGNMVLQTPPNSSFSSLDAPCQPKEKTDFKKSKFGRQPALFKQLGLHVILGCIMTPIKMQHFALLVQKYTKLELYRR